MLYQCIFQCSISLFYWFDSFDCNRKLGQRWAISHWHRSRSKPTFVSATTTWFRSYRIRSVQSKIRTRFTFWFSPFSLLISLWWRTCCLCKSSCAISAGAWDRTVESFEQETSETGFYYLFDLISDILQTCLCDPTCNQVFGSSLMSE